MATMTTKKPCAKCSKGGGVTTCDGCQQSFCTKHFVEHRDELSQQMSNVNQTHELLRQDLSKELPKHTLFTRIDTWEEESIHKIRTVAETARTDLRKLLDRTKHELNLSVEKINKELKSCQQSDDYTENDLKRWNEQLKELRKKLDFPATIMLMNDNEVKSSVRLIHICDKQQQQQQQQQHHHHHHYPISHQHQRPLTAVNRIIDQQIINIKEFVSTTNEKFAEIDGKATLYEESLVATCSVVSILTQPIIYGTNRYSNGKHQVRFRIEKMGEQRLFFGIIRALENISRSGHAQNNNNSLYGWWDLNEAIINGKSQPTKYRNIVVTGDEITLILDCELKQIQLQHNRTKRLAQLQIDLEKCPYPWKIVIRLQSAGDCVRIVH